MKKNDWDCDNYNTLKFLKAFKTQEKEVRNQRVQATKKAPEKSAFIH